MSTAAIGTTLTHQKSISSLHNSTALVYYGSVDATLTNKGLLSRESGQVSDSIDVWQAHTQILNRIVENPYVGISLGFMALCGAAASLALAYTGSF